MGLFLLAVLLTTSVSPVVLWQLLRGWSKERAILLTVLGINFVGDGLRDALDPRSQRHL